MAKPSQKSTSGHLSELILSDQKNEGNGHILLYQLVEPEMLAGLLEIKCARARTPVIPELKIHCGSDIQRVYHTPAPVAARAESLIRAQLIPIRKSVFCAKELGGCGKTHKGLYHAPISHVSPIVERLVHFMAMWPYEDDGVLKTAWKERLQKLQPRSTRSGTFSYTTMMRDGRNEKGSSSNASCRGWHENGPAPVMFSVSGLTLRINPVSGSSETTNHATSIRATKTRPQ